MTPHGWRLAVASDLDHVVGTLARSFADDPLWGHWALPGPADRVPRLARHWALFVRAGMKYDGVILSPGGEAVAVWIPPGVPELDADDEAALETSTAEIFGAAAPLLFDLYDRFTAARPTSPDHWCLSLLATSPEHRGSGLGMHLVKDFLVRVDADRVPAYLESTNPANLARYRGAGFEPHGSFDAPQRPSVSSPTVTTMWRPAAADLT